MFYRPDSFWTWTLLSITIVETTTVLIIESILFANLQQNILPVSTISPLERSVPTFLSLLIFGFIYQCLLMYDTLAKKNTIQLFGLCVYSASLCIYTALQVQEYEKIVMSMEDIGYVRPSSAVWSSTSGLLITNAVITGVYVLVISFISFKLYSEFQWTIYRQLNADLTMQRRYFDFKIYTTLLKFDFFFFEGFLLQYIVLVSNKEDFESIATIIAIPCTAIILMASTWFMRRENRTGTFISLFLYLTLLAFFVFKYVRMYQPGHMLEYLPARQTLTYFGAITLILVFVTGAVSLKCIANFDKGLKAHITGYAISQTLLEDQEMEMTVNRKQKK